MTPADIAITVASTAVGGLLGFLTSWYFFRRGAGRPTVMISLAEIAHIDPSTVGVRVDMKVGRMEVTNLLLLEVSVTNKGPGDVDVADADNAERQPMRPSIELPPNIRALADPWNPINASARSDVRIARSLRNERQALHVHIHRLASRSTTHARVLCTYKDATSAPTVKSEDLCFFPGFLANVDIETGGLLRHAPVVQAAIPQMDATRAAKQLG